jgi:soluble lytic murein transglycosylase
MKQIFRNLPFRPAPPRTFSTREVSDQGCGFEHRKKLGLRIARVAPIALILFLCTSAIAPEMQAQSGADGSTAARHHSKTSSTRKPAAKTKKSTRSTKGRAARSAKLKQAFVASSELRPMAQQLATTRTAAAYAGVAAYAHQHSGEAASAAYLALGHAYLLDNRFTEAAANLRQARAVGDALADYAEYLGAKAEHDGGNDSAAEALIKGFAERNPDSIFDNQVPELEAQILLGLNDFAGARRVLAASPEASGRGHG